MKTLLNTLSTVGIVIMATLQLTIVFYLAMVYYKAFGHL